MHVLRDLPYPDPGVPDARSGFRFLLWLEARPVARPAHGRRLGHRCTWPRSRRFPAAVGFAVQAVVDRSGTAARAWPAG